MPDPNEHTPLIPGSGSASQPDADSTYLARFQQAVGINAASSSPTDFEAARQHATGIYKEIVAAQTSLRRQFRLVEAIYYLALLANIVIGATLASLGPLARLHPMAITILGIVNSSVAGLLVLLKSQGLPDRLRKDEFEMRKVQDFVEEMGARLAFGVVEEMSEKGLDELVKEVFDRYNVARDTAEMNKPDSYTHQVDADPSAQQGSSGERRGWVQVDGTRKIRLALSSGKGKALVIS